MQNELICFRLFRQNESKGEALEDMIRQIAQGASASEAFAVNPDEFHLVPGAPFAYWVGSRVRSLFASLSSFGNSERSVKQGLATSDDFRFARLWWEVSSSEVTQTWFPMCKGGIFAPFYADLHLLINWSDNGAEIKAEVDRKYSHIKGYQTFWVVKNPDAYFQPGLTYPLRTARFSPQIMPAGAIISVRGSGIYCPEPLTFLALLSSSAFDRLVKLLLGREGHPQFDMGDVAATPIPKLDRINAERLSEMSKEAWMLKRSLDTYNQTSHAFERPALFSGKALSLKGSSGAWRSYKDKIEQKVARIQEEIDSKSLKLYELEEADLGIISTSSIISSFGDVSHNERYRNISAEAINAKEIVSDFVDYTLGSVFGRWDIRFATGEKPPPELPDPFAPLPACPPGQFQNENGLPITKDDVERLKVEARLDYMIVIPLDGILVDDAGFEGGQLHNQDIVVLAQKVLDVLWKNNAQDIERESCEILNVPDLRNYFRESFFKNHINRYSKSRRKAPIYWQLSTPSASYSIWLYYHRFTKDTFYKVVNEYIIPKLQFEERELSNVRQQYGASPTAIQRKEIAAREAFVSELTTFKEEVVRIAPLWNPNLNDGVIINFAPLWRLVPQNKPWQNQCKKVWDKLVKGDYDWAHLAMHLWPERVVNKCAKDRSLAIAHGLEETFWEEDDKGKWKPRKISKETMDSLIQECTSQTVMAALEDLLKAPIPATTAGKKRKKKV